MSSSEIFKKVGACNSWRKSVRPGLQLQVVKVPSSLMGRDYQPLLCNLCWEELQEPFIITSCHHVFCMKHEHDPLFKKSSCPGCGNHLPSKGGMSVTRFRAEPHQLDTLNGLQPDSAMQILGHCIQFWVSQERTHGEYLRHLYLTMKKSKEDRKENFKVIHAELTQELAVARQQREESDARSEDLKHEMRVLEEKYHEETRKVRVLQERLIDLKRKPGGADPPMYASGLGPPVTPERSHHGSPEHRPSGTHASLHSPKQSHQLSRGTVSIAARTLARLPSPSPRRVPTPFEGPRLGASLGSSRGGGSGLGAPSFGSGGNIARSLSSNFPQATTPLSSRHGSPLHRPSSTLGSSLSWSTRR